jgi:PIN domain nuclease of toxin-antitoxin system
MSERPVRVRDARVLLDTHVFLWAITSDPRLSPVHRRIYLDGTRELWLSVASVWEVLIKSGLGKLSMPRPTAAYIMKQMERNRVTLLPIRASHLASLETLPPLHRDPFDRMLVAQANAEGLAILSDDATLRKYPVTVL